MNRQADITLNPQKGGAAFVVSWKLCDNGFTLQGEACIEISPTRGLEGSIETGRIRWLDEEPPIEDQGLLHELILARLQDYLAGK